MCHLNTLISQNMILKCLEQFCLVVTTIRVSLAELICQLQLIHGLNICLTKFKFLVSFLNVCILNLKFNRRLKDISYNKISMLIKY